MINFFVTFFLLEITSKLTKLEPVMWRIVLGSILGALYSLIIFVDNLPPFLLELSKFLSSGVIVLMSFRYRRMLQYIKSLFVFYVCSVVMLGFIMASCYIFKIKYIAVNNSVLYFNISSSTIIASAFFAYIISCVIIRLYNRSLSKDDVYTLIVEQNGNIDKFVAFLDTGNRIREPFSNSPVIIVDSSKLSVDMGSIKTRIVPINTVSGTQLLTAFKPDRIILKSSNNVEEIQNVYIAASNSISNDKFSAILNYDILSI